MNLLRVLAWLALVGFFCGVVGMVMFISVCLYALERLLA
jgi:hypothetical protein